MSKVVSVWMGSASGPVARARRELLANALAIAGAELAESWSTQWCESLDAAALREALRADLMVLWCEEPAALPDLLIGSGAGTHGHPGARERHAAQRAQVLVVTHAAHADAAALVAGVDDVVVEMGSELQIARRIVALRRFARLRGELDTACVLLEDSQRIARLGTWSWTLASDEMTWSNQTHVLLGLTPGSTKPSFESFSLCIHPDDREGVMTHIDEAIAASSGFGTNFRVIHNSGSVRYLKLHGEPPRDSADELRQARGTLQDVTDERRIQERIRRLAHFDSLTGLSNRHRFLERTGAAIQRSRASGSLMAVFYLDLDRFKRINDTLGHSAGDHLLQVVADILVEVVEREPLAFQGVGDRPEVARLGGDEFALLLPRIASVEEAGRMAVSVLSALPQPIVYDSQEMTTTASIGVAVYPTDGLDVETLVKHADTAMYHAKEHGRNSHQFFNQQMDAEGRRRLLIESHLRNAIANGELRLEFQPRVLLADGTLEGVEALLRWDSRELGEVSPDEFIPIAEDTALMASIGQWVLERSCAQSRAWHDAGFRPLPISVNVSTSQFGCQDLLGLVERVLEENRLAPQDLELEITETLMLKDGELGASTLSELKALGVRIALDDFGTGYSSLSYLSRFPLDTLKLDRSFVEKVDSDVSARGIATAVISMAHVLGLHVVAEGVENEAQARFLREESCEAMQGFLVSGGLRPDAIERFFR